MGKEVSKITGEITSVVKAVPLIAGALAGVFIPARGSSESPFKQLTNGNAQAGLNSLLANYTFFSPEGNEFELSQGRGVKAAVAGGIVHKVMGYLF